MPAAIAILLSRQSIPIWRRRALACVGLVIGVVVLNPSTCASGQSQGQTLADAPAAAQNASAPQLPRVTTTVEVRGEVSDDYLVSGTTAGSLDGTVLKENPLSVTAVSRAVLSDQIAQTLSDIVKNDASVNED